MDRNRDLRLPLVAAATLASMLVTTCSSPVGRDARDDVTIEGSADGIEMIRLLDLASAVTGDVYFHDPREMAAARAPLRETLVVPREGFPSLLDECLSEAGFVDVETSVSGCRVHSVHGLSPGSRSCTALKTEASKVPLEELAKQPDRRTLVTSWMICRSNTLARQIACPILCQFFSDSALEAIRSIEGAPVIVMTGRADNVVRFAALGKRIDAQFGPTFESKETSRLEARIRELEESVARLEAGLEPAWKR